MANNGGAVHSFEVIAVRSLQEMIGYLKTMGIKEDEKPETKDMSIKDDENCKICTEKNETSNGDWLQKAETCAGFLHQREQRRQDLLSREQTQSLQHTHAPPESLQQKRQRRHHDDIAQRKIDHAQVLSIQARLDENCYFRPPYQLEVNTFIRWQCERERFATLSAVCKGRIKGVKYGGLVVPECAIEDDDEFLSVRVDEAVKAGIKEKVREAVKGKKGKENEGKEGA